MAYSRSQMQYDDGRYYKWTAGGDNDDPRYILGKDHREMDKTQGYEVLRFINQFARTVTWNGTGPGVAEYQKIERMIRYSVPSHIRTHADKRQWILDNWKTTN